jgi:DinB superfamily/Mycothiol maleylpyruvate isomerase N-terminal domain
VSLVGTAPAVDLRRAPLAELRAVDMRASERDFWADEVAVWDRLVASWAGLDDAAWRIPGASRSDAGGPDWSLAEHVGHLAAWQGLAEVYTRNAIATGRWPADEEFDGGDFDKFNERLREPWQSLSSDAIVARLGASRRALLRQANRLTETAIRGDSEWGWVYLALHGHYLDHLTVIETWTAALRARQADGDPFTKDPRTPDLETFMARDELANTTLEALLRVVPFDRWETVEVTPGWTIRDHVAHLADWAEEGARAIQVYRHERRWLADPVEGVDAWNERMVERSRPVGPVATLARYERAREAMHGAVATLTLGELRSPDGWSWAYDCLYGHVRKHLALLGPWCAAASWPEPTA